MTRNATWLLLGICGAAAFFMALGYQAGGGSGIDSATVPLILSGGIVLISLLGLTFKQDTETSGIELRPLLAISAAVLLFILSVERFGLIPATLASMVAAYLGQSERRIAPFLVYALIFAFAVWSLFSMGLGLPVKAIRGF